MATARLRFDFPLMGATIAATVLAQLWLTRPYFIGRYGDDACYVLQAWTLMFGHCPICKNVIPVMSYPPGWGFFLAPLTYLMGGERFEFYRLISLALTSGGVALATALFRRHASRLSSALFGLTLALSSAFLSFGSTLMSEPVFLLACVSMIFLHTTSERLASAVVQGLLAGFCMAARAEGVIVMIALCLSLLARRRWKAVVLAPVSGAMLFLCITLSVPNDKSFSRVGFIKEFFGRDIGALEYLRVWLLNQLTLLGQCYFDGPGWLLLAFAALLVVASAISTWRRRDREDILPALLVLGIFAGLLIWPFLTQRYWMVTIPLWLMLALRGVDRRWQIGSLCGLLCLQIVGQLNRPPEASYPSPAANVALYESLATTPPGDLVACPYPGCVHLYGHRRWGAFLSAPTFGLLCLNLERTGTPTVVYPKQTTLMLDMQGQQQAGARIGFPPYFELWVDRGSLLKTHFRNEAGSVARLVVPSGSLEQAVAKWRQAESATSAESRLGFLDQARSLAPGMPELTLVWCFTAADVPSVPKARWVQTLIEYFRRYPHDFVSCQGALGLLLSRGEKEAARAIATVCLEEARRLHDSVAELNLRKVLRDLETP